MRNYENHAYAAGRLVGTIVRHKNKAISIVEIGAKVHAVQLVSGEPIEFPYKELDITPVPLGYANIGGKALYISRIPLRNDWKQGLRPKNMRFTFLKPNNLEIDNDELLRRELPNEPIGKTIEGIYPSYVDAVKAITNPGKRLQSIAYDRNFALGIDGSIFHKGQYNVGTMIDAAHRIFRLKDEFWWAKEALEETLA